MKTAKVQRGECASSLAARFGLSSADVLWNLPENAKLAKQRENANVLMEGDKLAVPDDRVREESADTEQHHRFRRLQPNTRLRIALKDEVGEAMASMPYTLTIGELVLEGQTDGDGMLDEEVPARAQVATLRLLLPEADAWAPEIVYELRLGHLDPVDEVSGAQARMRNLGYDCGPIDGLMGPLTRAGLRAFQADMHLKETRALDGATRARLAKEHGC